MFQIAQLVHTVVNVLTILLLARLFLSYVIQDSYNPIMRFLYDVTEPILAPIRRMVPLVGGFDLSYIVASMGLQIVGRFVVGLLLGGGL